MDETRFDTLIRAFAIPSRRALLPALGGAVAAAILGGGTVEDIWAKRRHRANADKSRRHDSERLHAERKKRRHNRGKKLRTKKPKPPTVPSPSCLPHGAVCLSDGECCSAACFDGYEEGFCLGLADGASCRVDGQCAGGACAHGICASLSAGCGPTTDNTWCIEDVSGPLGADLCPARVGNASGICALADDGPFCAESVVCTRDGTDICQTNADCVDRGYGSHARCVHNCDDACGPGVSGCVTFYLDPESTGCVPYGFPCTASDDCCNDVPCVGDQDGSNQTCRYL